MIKFFFYRIWRPEKIEEYLNKMERQGYKLDYVSCFYFFAFRRSVSKDVQHLLSVSFLKDCEMLSYDNELRKSHRANTIPSHYSGSRKIFRISNRFEDVTDYKSKRNLCLQGVLLKKLLIYLMVFPGVFILCLERNLFVSLALISIFYFLLFDVIIGYIYLKCNCKK